MILLDGVETAGLRLFFPTMRAGEFPLGAINSHYGVFTEVRRNREELALPRVILTMRARVPDGPGRPFGRGHLASNQQEQDLSAWPSSCST
jgi:hypothetical protein